jgi:hypothetical protein
MSIALLMMIMLLPTYAFADNEHNEEEYLHEEVYLQEEKYISEPAVSPAATTTITVNFPGMLNVRVTYNVTGGVGWINLPGRHDNSVTFDLPAEHDRIDRIQVFCSLGGNNFLLHPLTVILNEANVFDVPVIPIRVTGLNAPRDIRLGLMNPDWVVSMHDASGNQDHVFNVFENDRDFIVRLTNRGQSPYDLIVSSNEPIWNDDENRYEIVADFGESFYSVIVPEGVTFVHVSQTGWIYQNVAAGHEMWFLATGGTGRLMFDYRGVRHDFPSDFVFDGTCIFCQVEMPACEFCGTACTHCNECPPFDLTLQLRPPVSSDEPDGPQLEIIRVGFVNPATNPVNLMPYEHFDIRVYVDGIPVPRGEIGYHWYQTDVLLSQVQIPLSVIYDLGGNNWENVTVWVSRGCAEATGVVRNPNFALLTSVTINFPGMSNVGVRYWVTGQDGGWQNVPGRHDNSVTFEIPVEHLCRISIIEVFYPQLASNTYSFTNPVIVPDQENVFNVPVIPIRVFGINNPNTVRIGLMNPNWVVSMHNVQGPVEITDDLLFNVFRNNRDFIVRLTNPGQSPSIDLVVNESNVFLYEYEEGSFRYEIHANFENPFYSVTVPQGVTGVRVAGPNWIGSVAAAGDQLWFLNTGESGRLMLNYGGVTYDFPGEIVFDGTCIFCQIPMPPCPGCGDYCTHCCDEYPDCAPCVCEPCPGCNECLECSDHLHFRWDKFNGRGYAAGEGVGYRALFNQSLYDGGMIRVWSQQYYYGPQPPHIGGTAYRWANAPIITGIDSAIVFSEGTPGGRCAFELGLIWGYSPSHFTVLFGRNVNDRQNEFPWTKMILEVMTLCGPQVVTLVNHFELCTNCDMDRCCDYCLWLVHDRCPDCGECPECDEHLNFRWDVFNNGTGDGAYPSRPNPGLAGLGTIRMWTGFGPLGNNVRIPFRNVTAVDQDDNNAMQFVTNNPIWNDTGFMTMVDVNKNGPWQTIRLRINVCGEYYEALLVNSRFFSFNIFNNGPLGCPSTPNQNLADLGIIRMWTQLGGVNARIPIEFADSLVATIRATGECALHLIRVGQVWQDGVGWLPYFNLLDADTNVNWEFIDLEITVFGQTVNVVLHNPAFVPFTVRFVFHTDQTVLLQDGLHIDVPVVPGTLRATWPDQAALAAALSRGNIYGAPNAPGHAFCGWFNHATLSASGRERITSLGDVLLRPALTDTCMLEELLSRIENAIAIDDLFNDGILRIYGIWSLWGDVNDDDYVNVADVNLLRLYVTFGEQFSINSRAADVVVDGSVNVADLNLLRLYVTFGIGVLGQQPPQP